MLSPGEHVGDYEIEKELGAGGMARVYKARHSFLETVHALKILDPKYRANPEVRKRFLDEAKIQAKHLDHPNIVKVTNIVATRDVAALVMEYIDGASLDHFIQELKAPPSAETIRKLMLPVLAGVGHAHAGGVVHRDIKPANILLQKGDGEGNFIPKVTDFGIAKVIEGDATGAGTASKKSTHADARMGTLAYMSPEQIRKAKSVTARSDIFSLGALLYELATRHTAFDGDSDFDVMEKIVRGAYEPPERRSTGLDVIVAACINKALQPDPAHRFASCDEFARALKGEIPVSKASGAMTAVGSGQTGSSRALTAASGSIAVAAAPAAKSGGRRWLPLVLILGAVGAGGAATAIALSRKTTPKPSPSPTVAGPVDPGGSPSGAPSSSPSPSAPGADDPFSDRDHRLFQAASASNDGALVAAVGKSIGVFDSGGSPTERFDTFIQYQTQWASRETAWITANATDPANAVAFLASEGYASAAPEPSPGTGMGSGAAAPTPDPTPIEPSGFALCGPGRWSGEGLTVNITGVESKCGTYTFSSDTGDRCSGSLSGCTIKGDELTVSYGCRYRGGDLSGIPLSGTFRMNCSSGSMVVRGGGSRWTLSKR